MSNKGIRLALGAVVHIASRTHSAVVNGLLIKAGEDGFLGHGVYPFDDIPMIDASKQAPQPGTVRIRRSSAIIMYWSRDLLVFENYLSKTKLTANALLSEMLGKLADWSDLAAVKSYFSGMQVAGWDEILETLLAANILVAEGSPQDVLERRFEAKWRWDLPARYFHFSTKNIVQEADIVSEKAYFEALVTQDPMPAHYKECGGPFLQLPPVQPVLDAGLFETLLDRRTQRWFTGRSITLQQLSTLLYYTWGKTASVDEGALTRRIMRTSPSGGCRHPIEVYAFVSNVEGLPAGIYHYSVKRHGLELIREGDPGAEAVGFCCDQEWMRGAAVYFVMTAMFERTMWRYPFSRAYRVMTMEAGHLGQTFQLVATGMKLHPFLTAVILDEKVERLLGLDELMENALYCCAVGYVKEPAAVPHSLSSPADTGK